MLETMGHEDLIESIKADQCQFWSQLCHSSSFVKLKTRKMLDLLLGVSTFGSCPETAILADSRNGMLSTHRRAWIDPQIFIQVIGHALVVNRPMSDVRENDSQFKRQTYAILQKRCKMRSYHFPLHGFHFWFLVRAKDEDLPGLSSEVSWLQDGCDKYAINIEYQTNWAS